MSTQTVTRIPAPRTARTTVLPTGDALQAATYLEFLYGYGAAPGLDLGSPVKYSKVGASVYRQTFERGLTVANLGDEAAEVVLEHPYYALDGTVLDSVTLAPHSAKVLLHDPA